MKNSFLIEITETQSKSKGAPRYSVTVIDLKEQTPEVERRYHSCASKESSFLLDLLGPLGFGMASRFDHNRELNAKNVRHKRDLVKRQKKAKAEKTASKFKP